MKRLLLVDDDAVGTRAYRDQLSAHGFQVNTAAGGGAALSILRSAKPDLVVLDLMMPDLSGVEVLKFIRSEPRLAPTPVVVLTNDYLNDLGQCAHSIGVEKTLLKAQCNPSGLMAVIDGILDPRLAAARPSQPVADPETSLEALPAEAIPPAGPNDEAQVGIEEPGVKSGASLLADAPVMCAKLRELFHALARAPGNGPEQQMHLEELFCQVHSLAAAAGQTEFAQLAQMAAAFDALLHELVENPRRLNFSVLRTLASLVVFMEGLFQRAGEGRCGAPLSAEVLVVDDDPVSNRLVVSALSRAQLNARSTEEPLAALQWISREHFDLVLLDIEMPVLNGLELCERMRTLPGYEKTPMIFVTVHADFDTCAGTSLNVADGLIAKPILPAELTAKVLMHLIRTQGQL